MTRMHTQEEVKQHYYADFNAFYNAGVQSLCSFQYLFVMQECASRGKTTLSSSVLTPSISIKIKFEFKNPYL